VTQERAAGGLFFALFIAAVLTSAMWYSVEYGFPTGQEY
jgi:mannose/fructose/N-acetylgalactosamine-specific phosphotransferase system component IID